MLYTVAVNWLLAITATASLFQAPWITHTSADGRYSISLPAEPQITSGPSSASANAFTQHMARTIAGSSVYIVSWADPPISDAADHKRVFVDEARGGLVQAVGGTLLTSTPYGFGEQGLEFTVRVPAQSGERFVRARIFFFGKRVYTLAMLSMANEDRTERQTRFFGSFKVLGIPAR